MEAGLNAYIKQQFGIDRNVDIRTVNPLTLAYIGDGIYELVVRSVMVARTNTRAGLLHRQTSQYVKAEAQSKMCCSLCSQRRKKASIGAGAMPSRRPWRKMHRSVTTAVRPDSRR